MVMTADITEKMIHFSNGNLHDVEHFLKVHSYARLIGLLEGLPPDTQRTLEISAIVHDIACPLCRKKYGGADGRHQEIESEPILREFFEEFDLPDDVLERIIFIVSHHHTYTGVDGIDYQILLEADFLVNANEDPKMHGAIPQFKTNVFKTASGLRLLESLFPQEV